MPPTVARDRNGSNDIELSTFQSDDGQSENENMEVHVLLGSKYGAIGLPVDAVSERIEHVQCFSSKWALCKTILAGQMLSCMLCSVGTAATALHRYYHVATPCFYAYLMYYLLALTFGVRLAYRGNEFTTIVKARGWKYFVLALLDVEANYMITKAYSFTTLTSVQLCDSFTIPTVMFLSFLFLRVRYKIIHYVAVAICLSGAVCLVFSDSSTKGENASNETLGDVLAISAAVLYGVANVAQEHLVKTFSSEEYLGMIGLCGAFISGVQTIFLEKENVASIHWHWNVCLLIAAFAICQFLYYAVMPYVMQLSSAAVVNLSLLTSDLYTMLVGLAVFQYKFSYVYFIAFGAIMAGLVIYNTKPTPVATERQGRSKKVQATFDFSSGSSCQATDNSHSFPKFAFPRDIFRRRTQNTSMNSSSPSESSSSEGGLVDSGGRFGSFGYTTSCNSRNKNLLV